MLRSLFSRGNVNRVHGAQQKAPQMDQKMVLMLAGKRSGGCKTTFPYQTVLAKLSALEAPGTKFAKARQEISSYQVHQNKPELIMQLIEKEGRVLIPSGPSGHAMIVEIETTNPGFCLLRIFNSGDGVKIFHPAYLKQRGEYNQVDPTAGRFERKEELRRKLKFQTMVQFDNVAVGEGTPGITQDSLRELVSLKKDEFFNVTVDYGDPGRIYRWAINCGGVVNHDPKPIQSMQKADNCTLEALMAKLFNTLSKKEYNQVKLALYKDSIQSIVNSRGRKGLRAKDQELITEFERKIAKREARIREEERRA